MKNAFVLSRVTKTSFFEEFLDKEGSVTMHKRNLQILATEMFKVYKNVFKLL